MQESPNRPTHYDLMKLPQRAIVAYALRCARRLRPLFSTAAGDSEDNPHSQAVEKALQIAERFCRAEAGRTADAFIAAKAAAKGAYKAGDAARTPDAANAAKVAGFAASAVAKPVDAAVAACAAATVAARSIEAVDAAARADYECLMEIETGSYFNVGQPIDPTEKGPLGPLWPDRTPEWWLWPAACR